MPVGAVVVLVLGVLGCIVSPLVTIAFLRRADAVRDADTRTERAALLALLERTINPPAISLDEAKQAVLDDARRRLAGGDDGGQLDVHAAEPRPWYLPDAVTPDSARTPETFDDPIDLNQPLDHWTRGDIFIEPLPDDADVRARAASVAPGEDPFAAQGIIFGEEAP